MNTIKSRALLSLLMVGLVASDSVQAHHSFPATYLVDQQVTIEGTVIQFMFRNPHSFIHVMVKNKDGAEERWAVEWGAGGALLSDHVGHETLKPGDHVIIVGNPGRDPVDRRLRMRSIERPSDGWKWSGTFG